MSVVTIGIDVGKIWFHLVGLDSRGATVARQRFNQAQLLRYLGHLAPCRIGMEASSGSLRLAWRLLAVGHDARLMSAEFIRPFVKGDRGDCLDAEAIAAEAIAQAVQHPTMRFVPVKMNEPLDLKAIHSMRSGLISRGAGAINQIRSFP
jgi:transposase